MQPLGLKVSGMFLFVGRKCNVLSNEQVHRTGLVIHVKTNKYVSSCNKGGGQFMAGRRTVHGSQQLKAPFMAVESVLRSKCLVTLTIVISITTSSEEHRS